MATTRIIPAMIYLGVSLIFSVSTVPRHANAVRETLRLGAMIPQKGEVDYSGQLLSFNLALRTVNRDPSLQFSFEQSLNDSMVSIATS